MALSLNEIKSRAVQFSKEWESETREDAEAKTFLTEFFNVFGINRRRVATFEEAVKTHADKAGYIDLFWKGQLVVEMKSSGKDLDKAYNQALDYLEGIKDVDLPKYILICDFQHFRLYDLEEKVEKKFLLKDFYKNIDLFGFITGYHKKIFKEEDPVNIRAAELMGDLHDKLKAVGYVGHNLEVLLVRLLFCLFADDTTIFERDIFNDFIRNKTSEDGSDLGQNLEKLFQTLDTPKENRYKNLDESLKAFPFVNGKLFEEILPISSFDNEMRNILLKCCALNWSLISPAIFGSMFQSVMDEKARRNLGAHYTSEKNILKLIRPLFIDELWKEFESVKKQPRKLDSFHEKISMLRFLDPACGCGNFLVVTYRELRLLEMEIIRHKQKGQQVIHIDNLVKIDVDHFYGIEFEEFPAQIAQVAMWLIDHQMNMRVSEEFGEYFVRLPLKKSAYIYHENALQIEWDELIKREHVTPLDNSNLFLVEEPLEKYEKPKPKEKVRDFCFNYILGNPPFIGYAWQSKEQKSDMEKIFKGVNGAGVLDYVCCWYIKAAMYMQKFYCKTAFVSTNSITQGEQVGILWNELFNHYKIKIHFAHRTFKWSNEAKGNAAVHVVIIGFSDLEAKEKYIYEYENIKAEPHQVNVANINPYLVEGKDSFIKKRSTPICNVPPISRGSDAIDDGNLLLDEEEKKELVSSYPDLKKIIRPFLMGKEFLNNIPRYCLWLKDISATEIRKYPPIIERIGKVKVFRSKSKRVQTIKAADFPMLFGEDRQPNSNYLAIPKVSSENRKYVPIAICDKKIICGDKLFYMPNSTQWHFGILTSLMHMSWMKNVCGRLKSDFSYSNTIVYNNFPWPEAPTKKQMETVEKAAQKVLDVRKQFPECSLADLYDVLTMPPALVKAHNELDKAVDQCYRSQQFESETKRIEFLFELYDKYTSGLFAVEKPKRKKVLQNTYL
ncbi:MAG: class I SAM-dependent DNA methyltransferase [Bacteroidia bacterium]